MKHLLDYKAKVDALGAGNRTAFMCAGKWCMQGYEACAASTVQSHEAGKNGPDYTLVAFMLPGTEHA